MKSHTVKYVLFTTALIHIQNSIFKFKFKIRTHSWRTYYQLCWRLYMDSNGSCLFAAGSPTDNVGSQNFQTFSTRQIAFWLRGSRCQQCYTDFLLQCAGDIEADNTDSGIVVDSADRYRETPHLGDWWGELTATTFLYAPLKNIDICNTPIYNWNISDILKWNLYII